MAKPPYFPFYPKDFAADDAVELMSTKAVGAYILLLCKAWHQDPPASLPNDDRVLARWSRLEPDDWREVKPEVVAAFTVGSDGRLHQKACDWCVKKNATNDKSARRSNMAAARKLGTHTKTQWEMLLRAVCGICPRCLEPWHCFDKDHIVPVYMGGSDAIENIQPLCANCNARKGPETIDWMQVRGMRNAGSAHSEV